MSTDPPLVGSFTRQGDLLIPNRSTESGWSPNTLMGRYLAGLVAWAAEPHGGPDLQPARLTVDMFRPAPIGPTSTEVRIIRAGRRIKVVDVDVVVGGSVVCRGTVVFLRRTNEPVGGGWHPSEWSPSDPMTLVPIEGTNGRQPPWDQRMNGQWGAIEGDRGMWLRETRAFIDGEENSPFLRVALAVDNANGGLNAGPLGLLYINSDLTLTLARLPEGEWIGLDPISRSTGGGVSVGVVDVYDGVVRIGQVAMCAVADERNLDRDNAKWAEVVEQ